jgi:arginine deiminase
MEKLSSTQVDGILIKTAATLRSQQARIQYLEGELAKRERVDHAEKIAQEAVSRHILDEDQASDYAEKLASSSDDLNMVEEFVGRATSAVPLGDLEKVASADNDNPEPGSAEANFATSLLSSDLVG